MMGRDDEARSGVPDSRGLARLHLWQIQGVRDVVLVAVVIAVVYMGYALRSVTVPLLVAFGLAYLVDPVVGALCRRFGLSRTAAVGVLMATAGVALVGVLAVMVPVVVGQSSSFVTSLRQGRFNDAISRAEQLVPEEYRGEVTRAREWFQSATQSAPVGAPAKNEDGAAEPESTHAAPTAEEPLAVRRAEAVAEASAIERAVAAELDRRGVVAASPHATGEIRWSSVIGSSAEQVLQTAVAVLTFGFLVALVPFYFWFFSINFPSALEFLRGLLPANRRERILALAGEMDRAVSGFVRGRIVISAIMGVLVAVGWRMFGVPYAITLGVVVGVFSLVPYLSVIGLPIAIGLLAVDQLAMPQAERLGWLWILLGPTIVYVVVQFLEGYVLIPLIAGKATDLDPVSIFVAVLAGAAMAGVYGMLLSIPVAACLKIWLREVAMPRMRAWSSGRANDPLPFDQA
jgi:predicted PurR-regulated permease PerM